MRLGKRSLTGDMGIEYEQATGNIINKFFNTS